jgi:hypothetical protein
LGDWYVNRIVVDRQPLLLLVSSTSLLPMVVPARDVRGLPGRLADVVETRLRRLGIASRTIEAETRAMHPVVLAPTEDRSVVGIAVDFAKSLPYYLESGPWDDSTLPTGRGQVGGDALPRCPSIRASGVSGEKGA